MALNKGQKANLEQLAGQVRIYASWTSGARQAKVLATADALDSLAAGEIVDLDEDPALTTVQAQVESTQPPQE